MITSYYKLKAARKRLFLFFAERTTKDIFIDYYVFLKTSSVYPVYNLKLYTSFF